MWRSFLFLMLFNVCAISLLAQKPDGSKSFIVYYKLDSLDRHFVDFPDNQLQTLGVSYVQELIKLPHQEFLTYVDKLFALAAYRKNVNYASAEICRFVSEVCLEKRDTKESFRWKKRSYRFAKESGDLELYGRNTSEFATYLYEYNLSSEAIHVLLEYPQHDPDTSLYKVRLEICYKIGLYTRNLGDVQNSNHAFTRMASIFETMQPYSWSLLYQRNSYNTIALNYQDLYKQYDNVTYIDSALMYYDMAERVAVTLDDEFWIALINGNRGVALFELGKFDEAIRNCFTDFYISYKHNQHSSAHLAIFTIMKRMLDYNKVELIAPNLDTLYKYYPKHIWENKFDNLYNVVLSEYYKTLGDTKNFWKYKKIAIDNRIVALKKNNKVFMLNGMTSYRVFRFQTELEALELDNRVIEEERRYQSRLLYATGGFIVFVLLWLGYAVYNYGKQRRINSTIRKQTSQLAEVSGLYESRRNALRENIKQIEMQRRMIANKNEALQVAFTDLKNTQSQLIQSEKMASLGRITSSITLQISNPVNDLVNNVQQLKKEVTTLMDELQKLDNKSKDDWKREMEEDSSTLTLVDEFSEHLQALPSKIKDDVSYASSIIAGLQRFSRMGGDVSTLVSIKEMVSDALILIRGELGEAVEIKLNMEPGLSVYCKPVDMRQVIVNVLLSAIHNCKIKNGTIFVSSRQVKEQVEIKVSFNGDSFEDEKLYTLFEPSDKMHEQDYGLYISREIIQQHQGSILVKSIPQVGTAFLIYMPYKGQES
jgi:signal transduction histidine kinase